MKKDSIPVALSNFFMKFPMGYDLYNTFIESFVPGKEEVMIDIETMKDPSKFFKEIFNSRITLRFQGSAYTHVEDIPIKNPKVFTAMLQQFTKHLQHE